MKFKKAISLALSSAMILAALAGCGKKSPKETFFELMEKGSKIESADATVDMKVKFGDQELVKIDGNIVMNNLGESGVIDLNLTAMGVGVKQKIYMKDSKTYTSIPMSEKFLENESPVPTGNKEELKAMQTEITSKMKELIKDENVKLEKNKEDKTSKVVLTLSPEEASNYVSSTFNTVFESETFKTQMKEQAETSIKTQYQAMGQAISDEEVSAAVDQQLAMMNGMISALVENLKFNECMISYTYDKDMNITKAETKISLNMEEFIKGMVPDFEAHKNEIPFDLSNVGVEAEVVYNSVGKTNDIDFSELTEENIVTMEEYTQMLGQAALQNIAG